MARADVHIFGSVSGYGTTAASAGVTESEKRELGSFQFGEAATADAIARLEHHAVMTGRPLASGRFAISRMLPAGVDDAGRPTIEVISLLLSASGYESCAGSMQMLASDVGLWRRARTEVSAGIEVPAANSAGDPEDLASLRAFDLWIAATRSGGVGVMSESESPTVLAMVCTLHQRDRAQCRWGVGMLSISAPVDIASLASGTSTLGARAVIRAAKNGAWHCEETECAQVLATSGGKAFAALDELVEHVRPHLPELQDSRRYAHETGSFSSTREHRVTLAAIGSAVLSSLALALGLIVWTSSGRPPGAGVTSSAQSTRMEESDVETPKEQGEASGYGAKPPNIVAAKPAGANASTTETIPASGGTASAAPEPTPPSANPKPPFAPPAPLDGDGDGTPDSEDKCPTNPTKTEPGSLGCDVDQHCETRLTAIEDGITAQSASLKKLTDEIGTASIEINSDNRDSFFSETNGYFRRFAQCWMDLKALDEPATAQKDCRVECLCARDPFMKHEGKGSSKAANRVLNEAWRKCLLEIQSTQKAFEDRYARYRNEAGKWGNTGSGAKNTDSGRAWVEDGERKWDHAQKFDRESDDANSADQDPERKKKIADQAAADKLTNQALEKALSKIKNEGVIRAELKDVERRLAVKPSPP